MNADTKLRLRMMQGRNDECKQNDFSLVPFVCWQVGRLHGGAMKTQQFGAHVFVGNTAFIIVVDHSSQRHQNRTVTTSKTQEDRLPV